MLGIYPDQGQQKYAVLALLVSKTESITFLFLHNQYYNWLIFENKAITIDVTVFAKTTNSETQMIVQNAINGANQLKV